MGGESDHHVEGSEHVPEFTPEIPVSPGSAEALAPAESSEPGLKHLEFLRVAIINGRAYAVKLYNFGKDSSGSFRPRVDSVEETLKTVTGPLADRIQQQLPGLLQLADQKVGDTIQYMDIMIPQHVKDRSNQAYDTARETARQAPDTARTVYGQVQGSNLYGKASEYYTKYQPVAEGYANQAWQSLISSPYTAQAIGHAKLGAEKINQILTDLKERNPSMSSYIPMIPLNFERSGGGGQSSGQSTAEATAEEVAQFKVK